MYTYTEYLILIKIHCFFTGVPRRWGEYSSSDKESCFFKGRYNV